MNQVEPFTTCSSILKTTQTLPRASVFLTFNYRFLFSNLVSCGFMWFHVVPRGSTWDFIIRESSGKIIF